MKGLEEHNVYTVVDRPVNRNPLGTTMIYKYKIDCVKNIVSHKCRLCPMFCVETSKRKVLTSLITKHLVLFSTVMKIARCTLWQQLTTGVFFSSDITQAFTYGNLDVPLYCHPPPGFYCPKGTVLGLIYYLYGAKKAPACFKAVLTEFMLSEGFTACNDSQAVWVKRENQSVLYNATFVDDVQHCTNDPCRFTLWY